MSSEELVNELEGRDLDSEALDELVHDTANDIASEVNNSGLRNQIVWLMAQGVAAETIIEYLED